MKAVKPTVIRGKDFIAVTMEHRYSIAAPGKTTRKVLPLLRNFEATLKQRRWRKLLETGDLRI